MSRADREAIADKIFDEAMAKTDAAMHEGIGLLRIRSAGLAAGIPDEVIAKSQENFLARNKPIPDGVPPLPDACPVPVTRGRIQTTPCSTRELMATFIKAIEEAGANEITVNATRYDGTGPAIEFTWKDTI